MRSDSPAPGFPFSNSDPRAPLRAAEAAADRLARLLRVSRTLAEAQRAIDITGFDGLVGRLCAQSLDLPPADGRQIRLHLIALLGDLTRLEQAVAAA
jgi:hypothetical protein